MQKFFIVWILLLMALSVFARQSDHYLFESIFSNWTHAFNHKDLTQSCALFAKNVTANYQGTPQKNYASICHGFKKIFQEKNTQYQYQFKLHNIYRSGNLATVRITWYLHVYKKGKLQSFTQDEGIDIFQRNAQGHWRIVNYLGYANSAKTG